MHKLGCSPSLYTDSVLCFSHHVWFEIQGILGLNILVASRWSGRISGSFFLCWLADKSHCQQADCNCDKMRTEKVKKPSDVEKQLHQRALLYNTESYILASKVIRSIISYLRFLPLVQRIINCWSFHAAHRFAYCLSSYSHHLHSSTSPSLSTRKSPSLRIIQL